MIRKVKGIDPKLTLSYIFIGNPELIDSLELPVKSKKKYQSAIELLKKEQLFDTPPDYIIDNQTYNELMNYLEKNDTAQAIGLLKDII